MTEYYYRFEDRRHVTFDEDGDPGFSYGVLRLNKYKVLRHTKCGVRLIGGPYGINNARFVNRNAGKQFALPTIEEAKASFIARKNRQRHIYQKKIEYADEALFLLKLNRYQEGPDW